MKEKLQEYALFAEILSGIAIIVTLVILIIELRGNTNALQIATIQNVSDGWVRLNEAVINDPGVARAFSLGLYNPDELSDDEAVQFAMWIRMFSNQVERVKNHYMIGLLPQSDYQDALRQLAWMFESDGGQIIWNGESHFDDLWGEELEPYWGQDRDSIDVTLGRDLSK